MDEPPTQAAKNYINEEKNKGLSSVNEYWGDKIERKAIKKRVTISLFVMLFIIFFNSIMLMKLEQNLSAQINQ